MLDQGRRSSRGRRKRPYEPHVDPIVQEVLRLTDQCKDYVVVGEAGLATSYLANLRASRVRDPGICKIQRILKALGYELVIQPRRGNGR